MAFIQSAGAKFYIGDDSSPISYVEVGEIVDLPEFGRAYNLGTYNPLSDRRTRKYKGAYNEGSFTIQLAYDPDDSGQGDLDTALDEDADYNMRIELNDAPAGSGTNGTQFDFTGKVMSFTRNVGTTEDFVRASVQIEITSDIEETEAA